MGFTICLDAGHYGKYNRSPVVPEYYESVMNWKLHNYLANELKRYGFEVIKTRANQNEDLDLYARGKKSKGCVLFLSLHSNACGTESVDRPVGIYLVDDDCGKIDEESKKIATLLAKTVQDVMKTEDSASVYSKLYHGDRDGDGKNNDDYYGVLYGAHQAGTAGVILEHSFHTNTSATKWLLKDENLQALAKAEAKALAKYYGMSLIEEEKETSTVQYKIQFTTTFPNKSEAQKLITKLLVAGFTDAKIISETVIGNNKAESVVKEPVKSVIKEGDKVKLQKNAPRYGTTLPFSSWVYNVTLYVREIEGSRVVVSTLKSGAVTGAVDMKYLTKI